MEDEKGAEYGEKRNVCGDGGLVLEYAPFERADLKRAICVRPEGY